MKPIFDLGLRSENIELWKFQICILVSFSLRATFKIWYFHFWRLIQKSALSKVLFWSLEHNCQVSSIYLINCWYSGIRNLSSGGQFNCIYFSRFRNAIYLVRNNVFSFRKKFLGAAILLCKKQQKSENRPSCFNLHSNFKLSTNQFEIQLVL